MGDHLFTNTGMSAQLNHRLDYAKNHDQQDSSRIAFRPSTGGASTRKLIEVTLADAGALDAAQLAQYWRKESVAAAKRMASRLGIRCIAKRYPWLAVWAAEGLATPPASSWAALQQNHLNTDEVAALLACDPRTVRRYVENPPDGFPSPVFDSGKPWLWRTCQIHAYVTGRPVPRFRRAQPVKAVRASSCDQPPAARAPKVGINSFNPFCSQ